MLFFTVLNLFFIPVLYVLVKTWLADFALFQEGGSTREAGRSFVSKANARLRDEAIIADAALAYGRPYSSDTGISKP